MTIPVTGHAISLAQESITDDLETKLANAQAAYMLLAGAGTTRCALYLRVIAEALVVITKNVLEERSKGKR